MIPEDLTLPMLHSLLKLEHTNKQAVNNVLAELAQVRKTN
jgi:hypothetical protein